MLRGLDNDVQLAQTLAQLFLASSPPLLARMQLALAAGDADGLARAAHEMKGAIGNFYAAAAVAAAAGVESSAQSGDLARAARSLAALEAETERLLPELEKLSASLHYS
jgi:HPt (histidine-containing phosphotransfer) domain-containing protein